MCPLDGASWGATDFALAVAVAFSIIAVALQRLRGGAIASVILVWLGYVRGWSQIGFYVFQPAAVLLGGAYVNKPLVWVHVISALANIIFLGQCSTSPWKHVLSATVAFPLYYLCPDLLSAKAKAVRTLWTVEALLIFGLVLHKNYSVSSRVSHLTWWNLVLLGLYDYAMVIGKGDALVTSALTLSGVVVLGVLYMSAASCTLLQRSFDDAGPLLYAVGNFAMHYYPLLRLVTVAPFPRRFALVVAGCAKTIALVSLYAQIYDVASVYGCAEPPAASIPLLMTAVAACSGTLVIARAVQTGI